MVHWVRALFYCAVSGWKPRTIEGIPHTQRTSLASSWWIVGINYITWKIPSFFQAKQHMYSFFFNWSTRANSFSWRSLYYLSLICTKSCSFPKKKSFSSCAEVVSLVKRNCFPIDLAGSWPGQHSALPALSPKNGVDYKPTWSRDKVVNKSFSPKRSLYFLNKSMLGSVVNSSHKAELFMCARTRSIVCKFWPRVSLALVW